MTPAELLNAARKLLEHPTAAGISAWPRAVAFLTRQALEQTLDSYWTTRTTTAEMTSCTMRSQLISLPAYLDPRLAREVSYVWAALSNACHYHPYDLAPTASELEGWMTFVSNLVTAISTQADA